MAGGYIASNEASEWLSRRNWANGGVGPRTSTRGTFLKHTLSPRLEASQAPNLSSACPLVKGRRPLSDHVTNATFEQDVLRAPGPVLVDFWADWCRPCHAVAPVLERIAQERNLKLVKVNYDEEPEIAERFGIMAIPNIVLFRNGKPAAQALGARPQQALEIALGLSR